MKLVYLIKEIEQDKIDLSALNNLDDEIRKALEDAPKPKNEAILTIVSLGLALPGILNAIARIINIIAKKAGIQIKKENPKWYQVLEKVTAQIDDYVDVPFQTILKPFIQDQAKRQKVAKILKAVVLTMMSIYGAVDIKQIQPTISMIKSLAPDIGQELIQTIVENNPQKIGTILKTLFK
jgi:hypothetical protein